MPDGREAWLVGTMSIIHDECHPIADERIVRGKMQSALLIIAEPSGCEVRFLLQADLKGNIRGAPSLKSMPKEALRQIQFGIRAATVSHQSRKINEWKDA